MDTIQEDLMLNLPLKLNLHLSLDEDGFMEDVILIPTPPPKKPRPFSPVFKDVVTMDRKRYSSCPLSPIQ